MRLYLSGPMSGLPDFNFPAFHEAAARLRAANVEVVNPAEHFDGRTDLPREMYLRQDVADLLTVDGIVMLPGWAGSKGAQLELAIAQALNLKCWLYDPRSNPPIARLRLSDAEKDGNVLDEAKRLVYGDRGQDYGHPLDDYERTSELWTALLRHRLKPGERVTADDAVRCMIAVKLSRDVHRPKRDNRVDIAGYAECLRRITEERERRER